MDEEYIAITEKEYKELKRSDILLKAINAINEAHIRYNDK